MAVHEGARYNSSEKCLDRRGLAERFARRPPSDSASVSVSRRSESRPQNSTGQRPWQNVSPYTDELAPTPPSRRPAPPRPMDMDIDRRTQTKLPPKLSCSRLHCQMYDKLPRPLGCMMHVLLPRATFVLSTCHKEHPSRSEEHRKQQCDAQSGLMEELCVMQA
jgi:hypothetical protein